MDVCLIVPNNGSIGNAELRDVDVLLSDDIEAPKNELLEHAALFGSCPDEIIRSEISRDTLFLTLY